MNMAQNKSNNPNFNTIAFQRAALWKQLQLLGDPRTEERPEDNEILDVDSYKLCHQAMYRMLGCTGAFSYIEPRIEDKNIMFTGLQMKLKRMRPVTMAMIDQAEEFFAAHIIAGREMFPRKDWEKVVNVYGGYPPLIIRALPEGTIVPSRNALVTIECTDPELAWMAAYYETTFLRAVWYPTTVSTRSWTIRQHLKDFIRITSDLPFEEAIAFMFHDFGARGVSSKESAGIGGAAHIMTGAMGTDTITGALFANEYYHSEMSAFSVFATEHSIMTMRGREGELQTVRDLIKTYNKAPGIIVSIVSDGYDIFHLANEYCTTLKQEILDAGIKLVVRPDSGDPSEVIVKLLNIFDAGFGSIENSKGFKVLNVVRLLQGDSLSTPEDFTRICHAVLKAGFSIENIVFGQGGGLLQQVNRDTYKFAMKTCAAIIDGEWVNVFKDPITDAGKRSKKGRLSVFQDQVTGTIKTVSVGEMISDDMEEIMQTVWNTGHLLIDHTLAEIQARANA
jgi:nicotinamide phosphoribosyltransferase